MLESELRYNCFGDLLENQSIELLSENYGYYDSEGNIHIFWEPENNTVDRNGFDKRFVYGNSYKEEIVLPTGTRLCRYGNPRGRLTAPIGTPYSQLALPYKQETVEYHEYLVVADNITVQCVVIQGRIAPMFATCKGGIQYLHPNSLYQEILDGKIQEDFSWLQNKISTV